MSLLNPALIADAFGQLAGLLHDVWREWRCDHDWTTECDPPACRHCGRSKPRLDPVPLGACEKENVMSKIGTAHVEIKPVVDEDALSMITDRIAAAVRAGVRQGMRDAKYDAANCPDCGGCGYVSRQFVNLDGCGVRNEPCPAGCPAPVLRNGL